MVVARYGKTHHKVHRPRLGISAASCVGRYTVGNWNLGELPDEHAIEKSRVSVTYLSLGKATDSQQYYVCQSRTRLILGPVAPSRKGTKTLKCTHTRTSSSPGFH